MCLFAQSALGLRYGELECLMKCSSDWSLKSNGLLGVRVAFRRVTALEELCGSWSLLEDWAYNVLWRTVVSVTMLLSN